MNEDQFENYFNKIIGDKDSVIYTGNTVSGYKITTGAFLTCTQPYHELTQRLKQCWPDFDFYVNDYGADRELFIILQKSFVLNYNGDKNNHDEILGSVGEFILDNNITA